MSTLLWILVLVAGGAATWWGSDRIEEAGESLARHYELPPLVQGTLLVAVGSSMPELATTVISILVHGAFELGMATVVGSAIFNILVIPGLSVALAGTLDSDVRLAYRDALFYLTSVTVLLLVFSFAIIYEPVPGEGLTGRLTRLPAAIPLLLYGLYLFLQWLESRELGRDGSAGSAKEDAPPATAGDRAPRDHDGEVRKADGEEDVDAPPSVGRRWVLLAAGVIAVVAGVEALLRVALQLEAVLGTPSFLWGATMIAAVTSAPDALISVRSARAGAGGVSLGNVLGSNIFDLLVAIPVGVLVAGATTIRYGVAAPLMGALTLATVVLFTAMRTELALSRREGVVLLALYGLFLAWLGLETAGVTGWVG